MQFQSIIRFINYLQPDIVDWTTLDFTRLRKLAIAEFSQASDGTINLEGFDYTRHEVIKFFEQENLQEAIRVELFIYHDTGMLSLLERRLLIKMPLLINWTDFTQDDFFKEYISIYFAPAFAKCMKPFLHQFEFRNAWSWYKYIELAGEEQIEIAAAPVRLFITEGARFFKNLNDVTFKDHLPELFKWRDHSWGAFLNHVYDDFISLIDEFVDEVINFTVLIQYKNAELCLALTKELRKIKKLPEPTLEVIENNYKYFQEANGETITNKEETSGINWGRVIFFVLLFAANFLFRMHDNAPPDFKADKYIIYPEEKEFTGTFDSTQVKKNKLKLDSFLKKRGLYDLIYKYKHKPDSVKSDTIILQADSMASKP
jgi:hypothetical protein